MKKLTPYLIALCFVAAILVLSLHATPAGFKPSVHGTAVFTAAGGAITNLHVAGCVTGVTYIATGQYSVSLGTCPANYLVEFSAADSINVPILNVYPAASYAPTGFNIGSFGNGGALWYDPATVFVTVIGE